MELRQVGTFLEVARLRSFSRAAASLGYSQSAVTMQVQQLERELGARLFDRTPQGAELTERGEAFSFHARELVGAARRAVEAVRDPEGERGQMTGTLRIGSVESLSTAVLPDVLARFHEEHPLVQLVLRSAGEGQLAQEARRGELDLFLTMERKLSERGFVRRIVRREEVAFVAAPGLARELGTLSPPRLGDVPLVLTEGGESYRLELERAAAEHDVRLRPVVETGNTETLVHLAERGLGVAFLPRFAAASSLAAGTLVEVPSDGVGPMDMWTQLFVHRQRLAVPQVAAFVELLRSPDRD